MALVAIVLVPACTKKDIPNAIRSLLRKKNRNPNRNRSPSLNRNQWKGC